MKNPRCPRCNYTKAYLVRRPTPKNRAVWRCKICVHNFTDISGTNFSGCKLPPETLNLMIKLMKADPGLNPHKLSKMIGVSYKTALIFQRKYFEGEKPIFQGKSSHQNYWQGKH